MEEIQSQRWEQIQGVCGTPGAEGVTVYGVRVRYADGEVWEWPDVDVDPAVTSRLVARLQAAQPARCHAADMVMDFIEEQAEPIPCLTANGTIG